MADKKKNSKYFKSPNKLGLIATNKKDYSNATPLAADVTKANLVSIIRVFWIFDNSNL